MAIPKRARAGGAGTSVAPPLLEPPLLDDELLLEELLQQPPELLPPPMSQSSNPALAGVVMVRATLVAARTSPIFISYTPD
jgi:hypothetical protein